MTTEEILAAATPRPWSSTPKDLGRYWVRGNGRNLNGKPPHSPIAQTKVTPYSEEANAAYIVLAVNAYERDQRVIKALSEALQDISQADTHVTAPELRERAFDGLDTALALAKEATK